MSTNQCSWPDSGKTLRHQYGISVAEAQTFLLAKRRQRRTYTKVTKLTMFRDGLAKTAKLSIFHDAHSKTAKLAKLTIFRERKIALRI